MKGFIRRVCALALCALLLHGGALADTGSLAWAADAYLNGCEDVQFHLGARVETLVPYGDDTIAMLNGLLQYISVGGKLARGGGDAEISIRLAGEPIARVEEKQTDSGVEMTTDLLPRRRLTSRASAMNAISGLEQEESRFDLLAAIREAEACYQQLTDAILPFAEQKAASYSIKKIGAARWSRIARLTPEQGVELAPLVARVLGCGMDEAFREQLRGMTCLKGFIVGLYQTAENGKDLAVYIKGSVVFPDGAQRAIDYQWAFATDENGLRTDTYKFNMTKNKSPRDNRELSGTYKRDVNGRKLMIDGQSRAAIRDPETGVITTTTITHDLAGENGTAEGTIITAVRTALGETASTVTTTITPSLTISQSDAGAALTGTVRFERAQGKNTHVSMDLLFDENISSALISEAESGAMFMVTDERLPESSLNQNMDFDWEKPKDDLAVDPPIGYTAYEIPEKETVVDLDGAKPEEIAALTDEMSQRMAGNLLRCVAQLPEDASALIFDNLADRSAFLKLTD